MAETTDNIGEIRNPDGTFAKGTIGRPKGAVTKVSVKVREAIFHFLEANIDAIQEDFDKLKPRERLQFVADILPYAAPKLSSIQTEIQGEVNHKIEKITVEIIKSNGKLEVNTGV